MLSAARLCSEAWTILEFHGELPAEARSGPWPTQSLDLRQRFARQVERALCGQNSDGPVRTARGLGLLAMCAATARREPSRRAVPIAVGEYACPAS